MMLLKYRGNIDKIPQPANSNRRRQIYEFDFGDFTKAKEAQRRFDHFARVLNLKMVSDVRLKNKNLYICIDIDSYKLLTRDYGVNS